MANKKPTKAEKDARAAKNALRRSARTKVVRLERELTGGDLDTRKARVRETLSTPPLASKRLEGGTVVAPKADEAMDEEG